MGTRNPIPVPGRLRSQGRRQKLGAIERRNLRLGMMFISPWVIGFLAFLVYPILSSLYYSFTDYSGFGEADWVGLSNYTRMIDDSLFWQSLGNTFYYTALAVPIGVAVAIVMALAMNQPLREVGIYRAALYLPSVLPIFALAFIFVWILNPRFGLVNHFLNVLGIDSIDWLGDPTWAKLSIVMLAQLGAGQYALVFLTSIRAIPHSLYDAAKIDGAGGWHIFRNVTLPLITPIILYDIIIGIGLGLQVFTPAYVMTNGGPDNSTMFYVLYLYRNAFRYGDMGYASAMGWILLLISVVLAFAVFRTSRRWVHYEMEV
jgi:multiple sugar transport system permease protein